MSAHVRVLPAGQGERSGMGGTTDRFMVDGADTDGRFALVEHSAAAGTLIAPMHRHHREDEFTYVLTGRIGAVLEGHEVVAGPGDLLFKPRGQWHTFWNAGDEPASCLELISPAGLEDLFRAINALTSEPDPAELQAMAARYECELDLSATEAVLQRHGLTF